MNEKDLTVSDVQPYVQMDVRTYGLTLNVKTSFLKIETYSINNIIICLIIRGISILYMKNKKLILLKLYLTFTEQIGVLGKKELFAQLIWRFFRRSNYQKRSFL